MCLTLAGATACSSSSGHVLGSGPASAAGHTTALEANGLRAFANRPAVTSLPPSTGTVADAEKALAATLPKPTAAGGHDAASVSAALEFAAHLVAVTRLDRSYLCGPRAADPAAPLSTQSMRAYLTKPSNEDGRRYVEVTVGNLRHRDDCGPLGWVGPGVVLGPQKWTVGTAGGDLKIGWTGQVGYALAGPGGLPEPKGLDGSIDYDLAQKPGGGWLLDTFTGGTVTLTTGWSPEVPVPDGYLPVSSVPQGDPVALRAVHVAAALWRMAAASTTTLTADTGGVGAGGDLKSGKAIAATGTTVAAPSRGDATSVLRPGGAATIAQFHVNAGRTTLTQVTDSHHTPVSGRTLPAHLAWTSAVESDASSGTSYTANPFVLTALLTDTAAAAPTSCPAGLTAARCYTAVVITRDGGEPLAAQFTHSGRWNARPVLRLDVGLDSRGRPAFMRLAQTTRLFGSPLTTLTGTTRFTTYASGPPPPVTVPDPATVAPETDVAS